MPLPLMAIAAAVSAAASVGGAIKGGIDADKKRFLEQQLAFLDNEQKQKLEKQLREATSEQERQKILASTIEGIAAARVRGLSVVQVEKEKTKKQLLIVGAIGLSVVLLALILVGRKK
jgi:hypothetical protein